MAENRGNAEVERRLAWVGAVTSQTTATLRDALFDALRVVGLIGVRLDVREVTSIDRSGIALLIGTNRRAATAGRRFVIVDNDGPVTRALAEMHVLRDFLITEVITTGDRARPPVNA